MAQGRFFIRLILLALPGLGLAVSCAVSNSDSNSSNPQCTGSKCGGVDAGRDQFVADVAVPDAPDDVTPPTTNPLCGEGPCLPDDPDPVCNPTGAPPDAGDSDADYDAGPAVEAGPEPNQVLACGVRAQAGHPVSKCVPAGAGDVGAPCVSSINCAPGLACVGEETTGQCRPYCCGDPEACAKDTYCAERPLKEDPDAGPTEQLTIPVCIKADKCKLDEPSPCTASSCVCKYGTVCAVVREDKTTSCVVPGDGRAGDPCPCAGGHVCSQSTQTCLKICSTAGVMNECGTGKCQSVSYLPDGFGVCGLGG